MSTDLRKKSNLVYLGIFLCLVCVIATAVMATAAVVTKAPIEAAKGKKIAAGLQIVLPEFDNDPVKTKKEVAGLFIYQAQKDGKLVGYAVESVSHAGYGGDVTGLVGFTPDGTIRTVIVSGHNETPGLGTKATDRIRVRTIFDLLKGTPVDQSLAPNKILDQFAGRKASGEKWSVKKDGGDVDFVSGATISSRAVADMVSQASNALASLLKGE